MEYLPYIIIGVCVVILIIVSIIVIVKVQKGKKKSALNQEKEVTAVPNKETEEVKPVATEKKVEQPVAAKAKPEPVKETTATKPVEAKPQPVKEAAATKPVEAKPQQIKEKNSKTTEIKIKPTAEVKEEPAPVNDDDSHYEDMTETQEISLINNKKAIGKYVISTDGIDYRYRLKASNGEVLIVSEPYANEKSARAGIETLKRNLDDETLDFIQDKHDLFSFRVMTKQGRFLATSANYKTKQAAISASESFKRFALTDRILLADQEADHSEVEEFNEVVETEAKGKFIIVPEGEEYAFQLLASNGKIIATSQTYHSYSYCKEGIEKFKTLSYDGKFLIFKDKNNRYQFKLYNNQKRLFLAGEVYDSKDKVLNVIRSIRRFAKQAEIAEPTKVEETK